MNDIITDFIGKAIAKRIESTNHISSITQATKTQFTKQEVKHINKCKKLICDECKEILKK